MAHAVGENPPGGIALPPANTAPGASMRTSATVGFGAITICAARSWRVIMATRFAAFVWHSALGHVTRGTMKSGVPASAAGPGASLAASRVTPPSSAPPAAPPEPDVVPPLPPDPPLDVSPPPLVAEPVVAAPVVSVVAALVAGPALVAPVDPPVAPPADAEVMPIVAASVLQPATHATAARNNRNARDKVVMW